MSDQERGTRLREMLDDLTGSVEPSADSLDRIRARLREQPAVVSRTRRRRLVIASVGVAAAVTATVLAVVASGGDRSARVGSSTPDASTGVTTAASVVSLGHGQARLVAADGRDLGVLLDPAATDDLDPVRAAVGWFLHRDATVVAALSSAGFSLDQVLADGGLEVHTTIDLDAQLLAPTAIGSQLPETPGLTAALVAVDPATGFVRAVFGPQQPAFETGRAAGSTLLPIVAAAALEHGINPDERFDGTSPADIPVPADDIGPAADRIWQVENREGTAPGLVELRQAVRDSINTAMARVVVDVGPVAIVGTAHALGVRSPLLPSYPAVLETNTVTALDLASAYATIADGGRQRSPVFATSIATSDGRTLWEAPSDFTQAITPTTAATLTSMLADVVCCGTAARAGPLASGIPSVGMTGTANGLTDAWFVGTAGSLTTAVWVGFTDPPREMRPPATPITVFGGTYPTTIWNTFNEALTH